jgi:hypothetical protein
VNVDWRGILHDTAKRLERIGPTDLVVAVPGCADGAAVRAARQTWREGLQAFQPIPRTLMIHADPGTSGELDGDATPQNGEVVLVYAPIVGAGQLDLLTSGYADTVRSVMQITQQLEARAGCVLGSLSTTIAPEEVGDLLRPVLDQGIDLMIPRHEARRTEGLITRGILSPLTRALFGMRLHDPMAVNFAASATLAARVAGRPTSGPASPGIWLANEAVCGGMSIGEAFTRRPDSAHSRADLGTVFSALLGSFFVDMERHAACWQRVHASRPVPSAGEPRAVPAADPGSAPAIDTARMVEAFQSAFSNLAEIWSVVLPPATLLDLKKLTQLPAGQFHLPDELWARIVFDMALGYRLRVISRDHLLRSFVPLYLAWVASWVMQAGDEAAAAGQQERLCVAFERQKTYLLSRWRWPDRFSP